MKKHLLFLTTIAVFSGASYATDYTISGTSTLPSFTENETSVTPISSDTLILTGASITATGDGASTTTNFKLNAGTSTISVDTGFALTMDSLTGVAESGAGSLTISGAGSATYKGIDLSSTTGKTLTISTGSLASSQTVNVGTGNTFIWNSTASNFTASKIVSTGSNITINKYASFKVNVDIDGGTMKFNGGSGTAVKLTGTVQNLSSGEIDYLGIDGDLDIGAGMSEGSITLKNNISMWSGTLTLSGENVFKHSNGSSQGSFLMIETSSGTTAAKISLGANNEIKMLRANLKSTVGTVSTTTIDLNGHTFYVETIGTLNDGITHKLIIEDFVNGAFTSKEKYDTSLITAIVGSQSFTGADLVWADTDTAGVFALNFATVPEPAEWAVIFGAIAFGFVAYRRGK